MDLFGIKSTLPRDDIMLRCLNVIVCCGVIYSITQALDSVRDVKVQKQYCQSTILCNIFNTMVNMFDMPRLFQSFVKKCQVKLGNGK